MRQGGFGEESGRRVQEEEKLLDSFTANRPVDRRDWYHPSWDGFGATVWRSQIGVACGIQLPMDCIQNTADSRFILQVVHDIRSQLRT